MEHVSPTPAFRALLGPGGPEIGCEECFERLDHYAECTIDGRDADASVPGMAAHLEGCPACREDYESLRAFLRDGTAQ